MTIKGQTRCGPVIKLSLISRTPEYAHLPFQTWVIREKSLGIRNSYHGTVLTGNVKWSNKAANKAVSYVCSQMQNEGLLGWQRQFGR